MIEELLSETRKFIGCIYKIAEAVALIDLVCILPMVFHLLRKLNTTLRQICSFTTYVTVTPSCGALVSSPLNGSAPLFADPQALHSTP